MFVEIKSTDIKDGIKYATLTSYNLVTYYTGTFKYNDRDRVHKSDYQKRHYYIENTFMYN